MNAPVARLDPTGEPAPVVLDSPHSGHAYPDDFRPAAPAAAYRKGEDAHVDALYDAAPALGAVLIAALFPRVYIDPNRGLGDLDPALMDGDWPEPLSPGDKSRRGVGLIWRRLPQDGLEIYDRRLGIEEVRGRIEGCWQPYHRALAAALDETHGRFGGVWHINCHSMPAMGDPLMGDAGRRRPDFIIGDRDGTTCEPGFTELVTETLRGLGYGVTVNDRFKGVELVRRYADPAAGRHSLQIEINRELYMDEDTFERAPGFARLKAHLTTLVERVCVYARSRCGGA
ncbi:MAG: N-formylglutamate amidohydrolase [Alphaproteobacteria bacterium]